MSSPRTGQVLADRYEVVAPIARGGMADVVEGRDRVLDRRVALKVFRAGAGTDRARFDAEALVLASLDHPNLVRIYDAGEHEGAAFVVLELIDGQTLGEVVTDAGPMAAADLASVGAGVADALAYVHGQGVVHRDVTPSNVLLDPSGQARLTDFGIARLVDTTRITAAATTVGTAAYMAPEQVQGVDVGPPADVYALGLVLLEALTGRRAFDLPAQEALVARLVRPPDTTTDVPAAWQPILGAMSARPAANRPTAAEVATRLRALAAGGDVTVALPVAAAAAGSAAVGPEAVPTEALPLAGGTSVMPVPMRPAEPAVAASAAPPGGLLGRPWLVAALAAGLALVLVLAANSGSGLDGPPLPPPSEDTDPISQLEPDVTTTLAPATTTPPPPTTEASQSGPPPDKPGRGEGRGQQDGDDDDDDDD